MEITYSRILLLLSLQMQKMGNMNKNNRIYNPSDINIDCILSAKQILERMNKNNPFDIDYILPIFKSKKFKYPIYWNDKEFLEKNKETKAHPL